MKTQHSLFAEVGPFYENLCQALESANQQISMMYFTFNEGQWGRRITEILKQKAAAGVHVRLMVDQLGQISDAPKNCLANQLLQGELEMAGVQVDVFKPKGHRLSPANRLHTKVCAIDETSAFIGGSNIGDHYTGWQDTNLRIDGPLGRTLHDLYDYIRCHTEAGQNSPLPKFHLSHLFSGDAQVWLTVPKQRRDIRRALLKIILDAETDIYIRNWYFLPDREILDALRSQAARGVNVHVLHSHRTRIRPIDIANYIHGHKIVKSGGNVYRFQGGYMHAKVAWNDRGEVLFGSANIDKKALRDNFECSLTFTDRLLAKKLTHEFELDSRHSISQTPELFRRRPLPLKMLSYVCNLASAWL